MTKNSKGRKSLERIYGKGCMFKKANIEEQIEKLHTIKTYKVFLKETHYSGNIIKQLENNMTYHHLRHKSEGGKVTDENGAVINELAHRYMHSLPREDEEVVNNMLRKFKLQGGIITPTSRDIDMQPFEIEMNIYDLDEKDCLVIPVYENTLEDYKKRQKFNRAKTKRETDQLIQEAYEDLDR